MPPAPTISTLARCNQVKNSLFIFTYLFNSKCPKRANERTHSKKTQNRTSKPHLDRLLLQIRTHRSGKRGAETKGGANSSKFGDWKYGREERRKERERERRRGIRCVAKTSTEAYIKKRGGNKRSEGLRVSVSSASSPLNCE